jgi:hypothetical protein
MPCPTLFRFLSILGDIEAVPTLLYKILHDLQQWEWHVERPYRAKSVDALRKNLRRLLWNAAAEKNCGALLVLLDIDDGCTVESVEKLAQEIRALNLAQPVAIVFAHRESPVYPRLLDIMAYLLMWYMREMWKASVTLKDGYEAKCLAERQLSAGRNGSS